MAFRAGAEIKDIEFIQFHPTALASNNSKPFLITEALRGKGATLMMETDYIKWKKSVGKSPEEFSVMWKYCENGSLGTRDIVARAIDSELKKSGDKNALLVTEHLDRKELVEEFPNIEKKLSTFGMNLGIDPIPVIPAAHYMVGGIDVDHSGRVRLGNSVIRGL